MNICIIHSKHVAREVLARALTRELGAEVAHFASCESALLYPLDYDVFVVYNNFRRKMNGIRGVEEIRARNSDALVIGVSSTPGLRKRFLSAGASAFVLRAGNEIEELVGIIQKGVKRDA